MEPWLLAVILKPLVGGLFLLLVCAPTRWAAIKFLPEGRLKRVLLSSKPLLYLAYVFWPALILLGLVILTVEVNRDPTQLPLALLFVAFISCIAWLDRRAIAKALNLGGKTGLPQYQPDESKR
jgi:hypothetical protein